MSFDGVTVACVTKELDKLLSGGRIDKIYMPDKDSIVMAVRSLGKNFKLFLSSNPSMPRISLTDSMREYPQNPPMFCMLLRKHLTGGRLISVSKPKSERIVIMEIESRNELGDLTVKKLIAELMGRHSNIILADSENKIIDCTRIVDASVSSVRLVMPGLCYELPPKQNKISPWDVDLNEIKEIILSCPKDRKTDGYVLEKFSDLSPLLAREAVFRVTGNTEIFAGELTEEILVEIAEALYNIFENIKDNNFYPCFILDETGSPYDFTVIDVKQFETKRVESILSALENFYIDKELKGRMSQKSGDIMKTVLNLIERYSRKASILSQDIKKAENKDRYRLYGDIITANIYKIQKGDRSITTENFYSENCEEITIPLDSELTPSENAQKYFSRYNKLKNTLVFASEQLEKTMEDIKYLKSVQMSLENCETLKELSEIKSELVSEGYIKKGRNNLKQKEKPSTPDKFISSDGFEILVGKNNKQNDYLTLKLASGKDIWFHTKDFPGSHTVIITKGEKVPDTTMTEAATLAAYYSKARTSSQVAVDYTIIKNVKKPAGAKAGMVIYVDYKTAYVTPNEQIIKQMKKG